MTSAGVVTEMFSHHFVSAAPERLAQAWQVVIVAHMWKGTS